MKKKFEDFISESLSLDSQIFPREITRSNYDWIYNKVLDWLIEQMKESPNKFTYTVFKLLFLKKLNVLKRLIGWIV